MIAPSQRLNLVAPISAERAAAMVVRGLVEKPARIDTPLGILAETGDLLPRRPDGFCIRYTWGIRIPRRPWGWRRPLDHTDDHTAAPTPATRRPKLPVRAVGRIGVPRLVRKAVRLVPGIHW